MRFEDDRLVIELDDEQVEDVRQLHRHWLVRLLVIRTKRLIRAAPSEFAVRRGSVVRQGSGETMKQLWMVTCKDGRFCNMPGFAGSSWEDEREAPYFKKDEAEAVVRHLDDPASWDGWDPEDQDLDLCRARCGPHSLARFVRDDG